MSWLSFEGVGQVVGGLVGGIGGGLSGAATSPSTYAGAATGAAMAGTAGLVTTAGVIDPVAVPVGAAAGAVVGGSGAFAAGVGPGAAKGWETGGAAGKWLDDKIAQMSGADTEADKKPAEGGLADACSTCPPPPGTECGDLYKKIDDLTKELAQRRGAMLGDVPVSQKGLGMYELYLKDPNAKTPDPRNPAENLGNWKGHRDQILEKQDNLNRNMKKYKDKKCGVLPPGAETQSGLEPPTRPFK